MLGLTELDDGGPAPPRPGRGVARPSGRGGAGPPRPPWAGQEACSGRGAAPLSHGPSQRQFGAI